MFLNGVLNDTTGGQLTVMLTGLIPFTVYNVTVQASNRIGASDLSESHTFTTMEEGNVFVILQHLSVLIPSVCMCVCVCV